MIAGKEDATNGSWWKGNIQTDLSESVVSERLNGMKYEEQTRENRDKLDNLTELSLIRYLRYTARVPI